MYTKGNFLLNVWGGVSHWRAELDGDVTKVIRIFELLVRETVKGWPFMGSTSEERQNGSGVLLIGSITDFMVSERVSRSRSPV